MEVIQTRASLNRAYLALVEATRDFNCVEASKCVMKLRSSLAALLLLATAHSIQARPKPFSLVRSGTVVASHNEATFYSFRVRRGQTISARIQSKTRHFVPFVAILSPSNRNLMWDARTFYSAKTTETGVYRARVGVNLTGTNAARGAYRLEISVR